MTQEEKTLLLQDLCSRLPYGVICHYNCVTSYDMMIISKANAEGELKGIIPLSDGHIGFMVDCDKIDALEGDIKPYLRPMSSMTEEEKRELSKKYVWNIWTGQIQIRYHSQGCWDDETECPTEEYIILFDWLNKHHFDYRSLIENGLALEAHEGMYVIK